MPPPYDHMGPQMKTASHMFKFCQRQVAKETISCDLCLALIVSHAAAAHVSSTPETYWKSVLPNTPIPKAVSELLNIDTPPGTRVDEHHVIDTRTPQPGARVDTTRSSSAKILGYTSEGTSLLFLEKDMNQGHTMNIQFTKTSSITRPSSSPFLAREVANTIPFSSKSLPDLYTRFSVKPGSIESESMKYTIGLCEEKAMKGEEKYCATSLEDMVDFTTSKVGKKVKVMSTQVINANKMQKYTIDSSRKLATTEFVNCHKRIYPYAVFYCHKVMGTRAYLVSLSGEDGSKAKALAVCHDNGGKLYPKDMVFKVLGVRPGTTPICHFLPENHIVFVPY
uniref:BURP domain-containing protein 3-like n=1 Tax=Erigeron canadensis TaxID=72917 RepID=UPI001CB9286A|nr:BURP domain-containing protein 3-like [Erigeron canadensis]